MKILKNNYYDLLAYVLNENAEGKEVYTHMQKVESDLRGSVPNCPLGILKSKKVTDMVVKKDESGYDKVLFSDASEISEKVVFPGVGDYEIPLTASPVYCDMKDMACIVAEDLMDYPILVELLKVLKSYDEANGEDQVMSLVDISDIMKRFSNKGISRIRENKKNND